MSTTRMACLQESSYEQDAARRSTLGRRKERHLAVFFHQLHDGERGKALRVRADTERSQRRYERPPGAERPSLARRLTIALNNSDPRRQELCGPLSRPPLARSMLNQDEPCGHP